MLYVASTTRRCIIGSSAIRPRHGIRPVSASATHRSTYPCAAPRTDNVPIRTMAGATYKEHPKTDGPTQGAFGSQRPIGGANSTARAAEWSLADHFGASVGG